MTPEQLGGLLALGSYLKDAGAFGGLILIIWLLLDGRLITRGHLSDVVKAQAVQEARLEAWGNEWRRLAIRGADDILPPLASAVRERIAAKQDGD